jgi:hypothetical protein
MFASLTVSPTEHRWHIASMFPSWWVKIINNSLYFSDEKIEYFMTEIMLVFKQDVCFLNAIKQLHNEIKQHQTINLN